MDLRRAALVAVLACCLVASATILVGFPVANGTSGRELAAARAATDGTPSPSELACPPQAGERNLTATDTTKNPQIVGLYPNPTTDGNAGEFVVLEVPPETRLETLALTDGHTTATLPNETVTGRVVVSTAPNVTKALTELPVLGLGVTFSSRTMATIYNSEMRRSRSIPSPTTARRQPNGGTERRRPMPQRRATATASGGRETRPVSPSRAPRSTRPLHSSSPTAPRSRGRRSGTPTIGSCWPATPSPRRRSPRTSSTRLSVASTSRCSSRRAPSVARRRRPRASSRRSQPAESTCGSSAAKAGATGITIPSTPSPTTACWSPARTGSPRASGASSRGWGVRLEDETLAADLASVFRADFRAGTRYRATPTGRTPRSSMIRSRVFVRRRVRVPDDSQACDGPRRHRRTPARAGQCRGPTAGATRRCGRRNRGHSAQYRRRRLVA